MKNPAYAVLRWRHYGRHEFRSEVALSRTLRYYVKNGADDPIVDETRVLAELPQDFLPVEPERILLMANSTGITEPKRFRRWGKYFTTWSLDIQGASQKVQTPTHDFWDGAGPVPAARHRNPDGTEGGWVAATAFAASTAFVGRDAAVFGNAHVSGAAEVAGDALVAGHARVSGDARVAGHARVRGTARVAGAARVSGAARVLDAAEVYGDALVAGAARVSGAARVFESARVSGDARVFGTARVSGDARVGGNASVAGTAAVSGHARVGGGEVRGGDLFHAVLPDGTAVTLTKTHLAVGCQCLPLKVWAATWKAVAKEHDFSRKTVRAVRAVVLAGTEALGVRWRPPQIVKTKNPAKPRRA